MMPLDLIREPLRDALKRVDAALHALSKAPDDERLLADCRAVVSETAAAFSMVEHHESAKRLVDLETCLNDPEQRASLLLETELDVTLQQLRDLRNTLRQDGATKQPIAVSAQDAAPSVEARAHAFYASWGATLAVARPNTSEDGVAADARKRFERALLALLRPNATTDVLREMSEALRVVARSDARVGARGFWDISATLLSDWAQSPNPIEPEKKKLCAALNLALRRAVAGTDAYPVLDVFAAVQDKTAHGDALRRVQAACTAFAAAPRVEHEDAVLDSDSRAKCLEALSVLRDALERLEISETAAVSDALRAAESFSRRCDRTGITVLQHAASLIVESVKAHTGKALNAASVYALAQTILLIEIALTKSNRFTGSQLAQIESAAGAIVQPERSALRTIAGDAMRPATDCEDAALTAACAEVRAQLGDIETTMEQFFAEPEAHRARLVSIAPALDRAQTILTMLGAERARIAIDACRELVAQCATNATHDNVEQFEKIAESVVELVALLSIIELGQAPGDTPYPFTYGATSETDVALNAAPQEEVGSPDSGASVVSVAAPQPKAQVALAAMAPERASDPELLPIFLEEAKEVLAALGALLPSGTALFSNSDQATALRRGFHTLKGSGRMVGLERFAAAAWHVESALNRFLENGRGAAAHLVALAALAHASMSEWVSQYEADGAARVDSTEIEQLAAQGEEVTEAPSSDNQTVTSAVSNAEQPASAPLSRNQALWDIYHAEASGHIETLRNELVQIEQSSTKYATRVLERAAHTLASTSGTMRLTALHELGQAFEHCVVALMRSSTPLAPTYAALSCRVVDALEAMFDSAIAGRDCQASPELVAELYAICANARPMTTAQSSGEERGTEIPSLIKRSAAEEEAKARTRRQFRPDDDLDEQLLPLFLEEADELVPRIGVALRAWRDQPDDTTVAQELQRHFHTLKGSARMAGAMGIGELLHSMETRTEIAQRQGLPDAKWFDQIEGSFDRLHLLLERVGKPEAVTPNAPTPDGGEVAQEFAVNGVPLLRVRADLLERVSSKFTELSISQARGELLVKTLTSAMRELDGDFAKLREQLRALEIQAESNLQAQIEVKGGPDRAFDPLELDRYTKLQEITRSMAESLEDFSEMQHQLRQHTSSFGRAYLEQNRLSRDLNRELTRMRLLPFSTIAERLHRVVRQSAKELGKRANLDIHGVSTEIDRIVLERITAPLEHLLRNAVVHGLENEAGRVAANKPVQGEIRVEVRHGHGETLVTLRDDGGGLDWERIRAKAVANGWVPADTPLGSSALIDCIFAAGFSTAQELTQLAGRGVGLDVVRSEVKALGGDVRLESQAGAGTAFTLHLPLTLALLRVVIVIAGGRPYALPASMIEHVQSLSRAAFETACKERRVQWKDRNYELCYLPQLLGYDDAVDAQGKRHTVLLLRAGGDVLAVSVDGVVGNREIVTKPLAAQLSRVEGVTGAALLTTGEIALVLNPLAIRARSASQSLPIAESSELLPAITKRSVLVVDDSVTVRKITDKFLTREGFEVRTAKNGLDALEQLASLKPDVMLVDIEMPQMDGFEFTRAVRGAAEHKDIPIIMITSRTAEKHRQHALDLGVNVFLGKPYTERELLSHIAAQLQHAA